MQLDEVCNASPLPNLLLEQASHWLGLSTRRTESYEPNSGHRGQSSVFGQEIEWQEFLPQDRTEARLITRGAPGRKVLIPDFDDFIAIYRQAVTKRIERMSATRRNK